MELELLNKLLANITSPHSNKSLKCVTKENIHEGVPEGSWGGGNQGEYNERAEIYQSIEDPSVFLRFEFTSDSYGDNDFLSSLQFVEPEEITIKTYKKL